MPQHDSNPVRISTPPRAITLNEHIFPTAVDEQYTPDDEQNNLREYDRSSIGSIDDKRLIIHRQRKPNQNEFFSSRFVQ